MGWFIRAWFGAGMYATYGLMYTTAFIQRYWFILLIIAAAFGLGALIF